MDNKQEYYNEEYYKNNFGEMEYSHGHGWEEQFARYAKRIKSEINPKRTMDVGCAIGFLVEALHDEGIEAYGMDISEYAITQVREDIRPFCKVGNASKKIDGKYDLITCIEVLEHVGKEDIVKVIENICNATDDVIFSSTPFDYNEDSHISVNSPEHWVELFAYNGFYHDISYDCSYISVQAMRFRRGKKSEIDLIRDYERKLFMLVQENFAVRNRMQYHSENVEIYKSAYQKHVDMINDELNPRINELQAKCSELECEINSIKGDSAQKIERIQKESEEAKAEFYARVKNELEEERNRLSAEYDEKRVVIEKEKEELEASKNEYEVYKKEFNEELNCTREKMIAELNEEYDNKVKQYECDKEKEIADIKDDYKRRGEEERRELKNKYYNQLKNAVTEGKKNEELYYAALNLLNVRTEEYNSKIVSEDIRNRGEFENLQSVYTAKLLGGNIRSILGEYRRQRRRTKELLSKAEEFWTPVFDYNIYREANPDVAEYYNNDKESILRHFIKYGMTEGRNASNGFNVFAYARYNSDVKEKYGADLREYYIHYIEYGCNEGRKASE